MSDYISREEALITIMQNGTDAGTVGAIMNLPAADVAPARRGEWIGYACSAYGGIDEYGDVKWIPKKKFLHEECGRWNAIREPFCPNCGAKMGGKQ